MGMPITVEIVDNCTVGDFKIVFDYFNYIDKKFSTYKKSSEITKINKGKIKSPSSDMKKVFKLAEETKWQTNGFFDIGRAGQIDPSGLVKGWAIQNAARLLKKRGLNNFCIEAGGDIQVLGKNSEGRPWKVGIRNPFNTTQIVKVLNITNKGIATSGTYERGEHIYNNVADDIISLTVIGPNIYEADRFATAAFAMGKKGIGFIESLKNFEGYMIDKNGIASLTSGIEKYA